jgi:hypothetical protein
MPATAPVRRALVTISLFAAAAATVWAAAFTPIPLKITIANGTPGIGVTGDGNDYIHLAEGKVPVVAINRDGVIVLDTRGSSRTVCILSDTPVTAGPALDSAPMPGCYPVSLRTLIRPDNQRAADVPVGGSLEFGMDVYWTAPAVAGGAFDYVLEYKRVNGNGVTVSHPDDNIWTVENVRYGQISVYRKGKNGGWSVVGEYDIPVNFTANRLPQN